MKYEVILFDADDTLFDFKKSENNAFKNTMIQFDINYDEDYHLKVYKEINKALWDEFEKGNITQEKLKIERFKRLSDKIGVKFDESEFADSYVKNLANESHLYEESIPLVEELHKNYKLVMVTNGLTDVQDRRIRKSPIAKYFENIVISEEVKASKPDSKIFEVALNSIKYFDKSKVIMIGDSLTSDIKGGLNFGVDTCWFNPAKTKNVSNINPTYEITTLKDIKRIL
ncbi:YjjG family noncanonical pyrimidine nucleotidase [Clostridium sp. 'White wine YQ']|uniref:YjjG family noncanonical pyrimidine nucleotidase n=1 Tax=Clostridium sp. 'White wine YQ' TaxID=3027474 RepID=UPI0023652D11|nr:YjjG family noncanonical pyrimidine nucleotidase [Clostridium sp. 'White wine YQ']MDD7794453.1 YjjG family noncanonical pyrimidine nucleotidase [Clostridium sp. 'White wine YQ']